MGSSHLRSKPISLKLKIYITSVLISILVITTYAVVNHTVFANEAQKVALHNGIEISKKKQNLLTKFFNNSKDSLNYLYNSHKFLDYSNRPTKENTKKLNNFFYHLMAVEKKYMQIRYIDEKGMERVKVERCSKDIKPSIVKQKDLQNKANRYYFKKAENLEKGQYWFSKIDLNIENNKIEIPYKPTLRAILPVYKDDKFKGAFVINYFMDDFLNMFSNSPLYDLILCNEKGYTIVHYDDKKSWGMHKVEKFNIKDEFKYNYKKILTNKTYKNQQFISIKYDSPIDDGLIMILQLKKEYLEFHKDKKTEEMIITSLIVLLISLVGSFILINIVQKIILHKDKMIFEQNKLASMGQMIENIAHQWRQPLAQINSVIYRMDHEINKKEIDKDALIHELDEIETVTGYLSQTINDFKEFLNVNNQKEPFCVNLSIEKTISIVNASFTYNNIKITSSLKNNIKINNYHNLLEQSILSILNNAKDVLVEKNISNPWVNIELETTKDHIILTISDNGGGIKVKPIESIFEPYFTTKQHQKGTGLGLYISKMMIVQGMNGEIDVENTTDGAQFKIKLDRRTYEFE